EVREIAVVDLAELDAALSGTRSKGFDALFVPGDAMFSRERDTIVGRAATLRLPAIYGDRLFPDGGGLMSFSVDLVQLCRRAAGYVYRILRGAGAGDRPVEEAVKFDVVINVGAANALGLRIPPALRERAELVG